MASFLHLWREGDWQAIAKNWPEFDLSTIGVALTKKSEVCNV